jgi:glutaredoxin 3
MMAPKIPVPIKLYTRRWCWYCFAARRLFNRLEIDFNEISVDGLPDLRREVSQRAGNWATVPMIFIGDRFVGGYQEASELHRRGELEKLCFPD